MLLDVKSRERKIESIKARTKYTAEFKVGAIRLEKEPGMTIKKRCALVCSLRLLKATAQIVLGHRLRTVSRVHIHCQPR